MCYGYCQYLFYRIAKIAFLDEELSFFCACSHFVNREVSEIIPFFRLAFIDERHDDKRVILKMAIPRRATDGELKARSLDDGSMEERHRDSSTGARRENPVVTFVIPFKSVQRPRPLAINRIVPYHYKQLERPQAIAPGSSREKSSARRDATARVNKQSEGSALD